MLLNDLVTALLQFIIISNHVFCVFGFYLAQWVSHRNHRGNICGVDFIWLLNPNKFRKPLKTSWAEAVFGIVKVSNFAFFLKNIVPGHVQVLEAIIDFF